MHVTLAEAATNLPEFAARAEVGENVVLTRGDAKPTPEEKRAVLKRYRGVGKGRPEWEGVTAATAADFLYDDHGLPA